MKALIGALTGTMNKTGKSTKRTQKNVSVADAAQASGLDEASIVQVAKMLNSAKEVVTIYGDGIYGRSRQAFVLTHLYCILSFRLYLSSSPNPLWAAAIFSAS